MLAFIFLKVPQSFWKCASWEALFFCFFDFFCSLFVFTFILFLFVVDVVIFKCKFYFVY